MIQDPTRPRIHIGLEVSDLETSISFYRTLFGVAPSKRRPGYAKFEPESPSVNLALVVGAGGRSGAGHFGVQVATSAEVWQLAERLESSGRKTRVERETDCCYSTQDKVWAEDPDGNPWEVFTVLTDDAPATSCCNLAAAEESGR